MSHESGNNYNLSPADQGVETGTVGLEYSLVFSPGQVPEQDPDIHYLLATASDIVDGAQIKVQNVLYAVSQWDRSSVRVTRRAALMALPVVSGLVAACSPASQPTPPKVEQRPTSRLTRLDSTVGRVKPGTTDIIEVAAQLYNRNYGCRHTSLSVGRTPPEITPQGATTLEIASAGRIAFAFDEIERRHTNDYADAIRRITLHAMTHACKVAQPRLLSEPSAIQGNQGSITGYEGLTFLIRLPSGEDTKFPWIEEGAAETLAKAVDNDYVGTSPQYHRLGQLTIGLTNSVFGRDARILSRMMQSNDGDGFIQAVRGVATVSHLDRNLVMTWYQRTFDGENPKAIQDEMAQWRGRPITP